ncbi:MAG TPA: FtsX-like permease family protein [Bryobacteraceae bacterium]|nr:FtsX-like permease family protein [Bryobacteraceae bacterium]
MSFRYLVRTLARAPGFTALATATLALGIGINTVVLTVYASVAFRPLPVHAPAEMVRLRWHTTGFNSDLFSWADYERLSKMTRSFQSLLATSAPQPVICAVSDEPANSTDIVRVRFVSSNYFDALGVSPQLGRTLTAKDGQAAIVSHDFWVTKLHSDPQVYGKALRFQGGSLSILGVAPKSFTGTGLPPQVPDVWTLASSQPMIMSGVDWQRDATAREWQVLARRNAGVSDAQASAELKVVSARWPLDGGQYVHLDLSKATFFQTDGGAFEGFRTVCAALLVAVALVLVIACVNLTHLIASRNSGREQEIGLRLALGASRARVIWHLCAESLTIGILGGITGLLLSIAACEWLQVKAVEVIHQVASGLADLSLDLSPDWHVFTWTSLISVLTGIGVGTFPALRASSRDINLVLKKTAVGGFSHGMARSSRNILLAAQVASCLVLLAAAGLLFRGAARSATIHAGFDVPHLAVVGMDTRGIAGTAPERLKIEQQALERMKTVPAVVSVAWADRVPFLGTGSGLFRNDAGMALGCVFNGVSDEYFSTLRIPVLRGRTFTKSEIEREAPVAIVSESTAARLWPRSEAVGQRLTPAASWLSDILGHQSLTVIGVVRTVRSTYLSKEDKGYVYMPRKLHDGGALFLVRTAIAPARVLSPLAETLTHVNSNLSARTYIVSMEHGPVLVQELMARAPALAASILGGLALLLACLGIYGVVSQLVSRRTREIGLRLALGATASDIVTLVGTETLRPVAWGTAIGLIGAFGVSGLLHAFIVLPDAPDLTYGAGAFDPEAFLAVLGVLLAVVLLASFVPLRRASIIDPFIALRQD